MLSEQDLLNAYLDSPDDDYSTLEAQLRDAQTLVATVQALTEQAEAHSEVLKGALANVSDLLTNQTGAYLEAINSKHNALKELVAAAELETRYNQDKVETLQELNALEADLLVRLQEGADAGNQEAQHLLNVAQFGNFAAAAELYHRSYRDLMSDTGARCSGGVTRPSDIQKADQYYKELIKYRGLQQQAQAQANHFAQIKAEAEDQVRLIKTEQAEVQQELEALNDRLARVEGNISELKQEIALAELQVDTLQQLRAWTEQTLVQLAEVEKLNLAQVQLEHQFLSQRQEAIDDAITARVDRDRLSIERDFNLATAQLERLNQFQTIDDLEETLQSVQFGLGNAIAEDLVDGDAIADQLIEAKAQLNTLIQEAVLPPEIQALLDEINQNIDGVTKDYQPIDTIQGNLVTIASALVEQGNRINADLTQITEEETTYRTILEQSETDLKAAAKTLHDEIVRSQAFGDQTEAVSQKYLTALYKVGYAEGAIDLSSELAKQSKRALEDIIDQRIEERITRKKFFLNDLLSTVTTALGLVSTILQFTPLAPLGTALGAASGILGAVQSAYNGDWAGAIFKVSMAVVSYGISTTSAKLDVAKEALSVATAADDIATAQAAQTAIDSLTAALNGFKTTKVVATSAYYGYQAIESDDNILTLLQAVKGVADIVEINFEISSIPGNILLTAGQVSVTAYNGIQAIQNGDLWDVGKAIISIGKTINKNFFQNPALNPPSSSGSGNGSGNGNPIPNSSSIFQDIFDFGKGIATDVNEFLKDNFGITFDDISNLYKNGEKIYNTIDSLIGAYKTGGLDAWLQSLDSVLNIWKTDIESAIDGIVYDTEVIELAKELKISPENIEIDSNGDIYFTGDDFRIFIRPADENPDDFETPDLTYDPDILRLADQLGTSPEFFEIQGNGDIYFIPNEETPPILAGFTEEKQIAESIEQLDVEDQPDALQQLPEELQVEVIHHLTDKYPTSQEWYDQNPSEQVFLENAPDDLVFHEEDPEHELVKQALSITGTAEDFRTVLNTLNDASDPSLKNKGQLKVLQAKVSMILADATDAPIDKKAAQGLYFQGKVLSATHDIGNNPVLKKFFRTVTPHLKKINGLEDIADKTFDNLTQIRKNTKGILSFKKLGGTFGIALSVADIVIAEPGEEKAKAIAGALGSALGALAGSAFGPFGTYGGAIAGEYLTKKGVGFIYSVKNGKSIHVDPVVLDLNNDGIDLISLDQSSVEFDMDNDEVSDRTGWLSSDDGFLAHDRNGDGHINNITELFSEHHSPGANTGLQALATLDSNNDQRIDIQDAAFTELSVWRDRNTNGTTDPGELVSLGDVGVSAIALNSTHVNENRHGNILLSTTYAQQIDGSRIDAAEVAFLVNPGADDELIGKNTVEGLGRNLDSISNHPASPDYPRNTSQSLADMIFMANPFQAIENTGNPSKLIANSHVSNGMRIHDQQYGATTAEDININPYAQFFNNGTPANSF